MSDDENDDPFDEPTVEDVAAEHDVDGDRLRELVAAHQRAMASSPGVENLVYEWRKRFAATVLFRSDDWYFVDVPGWAWEEFAEYLDADEGEVGALAALHARVVADHAAVDPDSVDDGPGEGTTPMVLRRE